jgi:hypothetical protein
MVVPAELNPNNPNAAINNQTDVAFANGTNLGENQTTGQPNHALQVQTLETNQGYQAGGANQGLALAQGSFTAPPADPLEGIPGASTVGGGSYEQRLALANEVRRTGLSLWQITHQPTNSADYAPAGGLGAAPPASAPVAAPSSTTTDEGGPGSVQLVDPDTGAVSEAPPIPGTSVSPSGVTNSAANRITQILGFLPAPNQIPPQIWNRLLPTEQTIVLAAYEAGAYNNTSYLVDDIKKVIARSVAAYGGVGVTGNAYAGVAR